MKKLLKIAFATAFFAGPAQAQVLSFEGIATASSKPIGNFYNGGAGTNFGIDFFGNALAVNSSVGGCGGLGSNFALQSSGCGVLFFLTSASTGMNRAAGFLNGFSLFYSAAFEGGSLQVFDGLNGTGTLLGSLGLPATGSGKTIPNCLGQDYCPWTAVGLTFSGTAKSILFSGVANQIGFDDVTFGSSTPGATVPQPPTTVPEPSTYVLMAAGLAGLGAVSRRRKNVQV